MKKLLVFLSIFAILFVSTIRPLQAEFLDDDFSFINGNTYYFIIDHSTFDTQIGSGRALIISAMNGTCDIYYQTSSTSLFVEYGNTTDGFDDYTIPLTYVGTIDFYLGFNNTRIENPSIYSFVWFLPSVNSFAYEDYFYAFDTDNPIPPISIYDTIYSLINKFVFGNSIESGTHQDLIATLLSSIAVVFVFALPFLLVWKVVKLIMG